MRVEDKEKLLQGNYVPSRPNHKNELCTQYNINSVANYCKLLQNIASLYKHYSKSQSIDVVADMNGRSVDMIHLVSDVVEMVHGHDINL